MNTSRKIPDSSDKDNGHWEKSWSEAYARLLHNTCRVDEKALREYWDRRSAYYGEMTSGDGPLHDAVISYLQREQILRPHDSVLDIGCGTGQYTLMLAKSARSVTGLDISDGMLRKMAEEASKMSIDNIHAVCSDWESFDSEERFDLVFSAFCPGVNEPDALFRMEEFSRRDCCYLTGGGMGQPAFIYELWEQFTGEKPIPVNTDEFFSFNALCEAGRRPSVRCISQTSVSNGGNHDVENAILYFEMLLGPDQDRNQIIAEYLEGHRHEDWDEVESDRSLYVVHWSP